jgi:hypothetical protein
MPSRPRQSPEFTPETGQDPDHPAAGIAAGDHPERYRPLSVAEGALLRFLLSIEFPGVEALRIQAESVRVRRDGVQVPRLLVLDVADRRAPRAEVVHSVPVETRVRGARPPQDLLLFVLGGVLDSGRAAGGSGG